MGGVLTVLPADANELTSSRTQQEYTVEKCSFHSMKLMKPPPVPDPMLGAKILIVVAHSSCPRGIECKGRRGEKTPEHMHSFIQQIWNEHLLEQDSNVDPQDRGVNNAVISRIYSEV